MKKLTVIFFILCNSVVLRSQGTWTQQSIPVTQDLTCICAVDNNTAWACGYQSSTAAVTLIRTTNGGTNWTVSRGNIPDSLDLYTIFAHDASNCWVGTGNGKVYRTTNGGTNWTAVSLNPAMTGDIYVNAIHFYNSSTGFIIADPMNHLWTYYYTTNGGQSWVYLPPNFYVPTSIYGWNNSYCTTDTAHIWFGTNSYTVCKGSLKGGFVSNLVSSSIPNVFGVGFFNPGNGTALLQSGPLYTTTNSGINWDMGSYSTGQTPMSIKCFNANNGIGWLCTNGTSSQPGRIFRTSNSGNTWTEQPTSLPAGKSFTCISFSGVNNGWAGTSGTVFDKQAMRQIKSENRKLTGNAGIYKYADNITFQNNESGFLFTDFHLKQNFPNPFNPRTSIRYILPEKCYVNLCVYDITGKEIAVLENGYRNPGEHELFFNGNGLPSGNYILVMESGNYRSQKIMLLLK